MLGTVWSSAATAAMVSTGTMISEQQVQVDRQQLLSMLEKQQVQTKLADMGVSEDQVRDRINSLTPQELSDFQQQLAEAPAGEGVVGIIVLFLVIFIVTDMLCATDIFPFVNCIR
jgi:formate-dependent phosphoribosylglycinamide formyltransferase (GAR transformylase)